MERSFHILLYRAFHAQRNYLRPSLVALGLGAGQPKVLAFLAARGPQSQREIADYFDVDPANISRMVESLERGGFVRRQADARDKRRDRVAVTEAGRSASAQWQARCRELEARMLRGFTPDEREAFAGYLARAYQNLQGRGQEDA